jgi:hypothetical protein
MMTQSNPDYHYVAYFDEAGDDGLKALKPPVMPNGSSEWLILSAVVIRAENQSKVEDWVTAIKSEFRNHSDPIFISLASIPPSAPLLAG